METAKPSVNPADVAAAQAAIDAHKAARGLSEDLGPHEDAWHLLRSLLDWCDAWNVDLDCALAEARADACAFPYQA